LTLSRYTKRLAILLVVVTITVAFTTFHPTPISAQTSQGSAAWVTGVWFTNGFNNAVAAATNMGTKAATICFDVWDGNNGTMINRYCSENPVLPHAIYGTPYYIVPTSGSSSVLTIIAYAKGGTAPIIAWGYVMNIQNNVATVSASLTWTPTSAPSS